MPLGLVIWGCLRGLLLSVQEEVKISHHLPIHPHSFPISHSHLAHKAPFCHKEKSVQFRKNKTEQALPTPTWCLPSEDSLVAHC